MQGFLLTKLLKTMDFIVLFPFIFLQIMTPSLTFVCDDHININARTIVLKQTIPLTCPGEDDCEIEPKVSTSEDVQGRCPKIGIQEKTCAAKLLSENEVGSNIEVIVTCPSDEQYMQNDGFYQVYLITTATSGIWANYVLDPINVSKQIFHKGVLFLRDIKLRQIYYSQFMEA